MPETSSEAVTGGVMHFSVDGDWLCDIVRDTVLSDRADSAVRILREIEMLAVAERLLAKAFGGTS